MPPLATAVPTIDDATRRDLLRCTGVVTLAGLLAACGDTAGTDTPTEAGGATRTVTDGTGREVEVPARPRRIVALSDANGADQLLSLGAPVVGMVTRDGGFDLADIYDVEGIESIGPIFEIDLEALAAVQPDLIIGPASGGVPSGYEELAPEIEAVAQTVWLDFFRPVEEIMAEVARLVAAEDALADLQADYQARIEALRSALEYDPAELSVSVVQFNDGVVDVFGEGWFPFGEVLEDLGVTRPANQRTGEAAETCCASISLERMDEIDADVVLYTVASADHSELEVFQQLRAVQAGQAFEWPAEWFGNSYRGLGAVLDDLEEWLPGLDPTIV